MALTSLAQVKAYLGETSSANDAWYSALLAAAESVVKSHLGRQIEQGTYTHFFSGSGTRTVPLRETPVTSVTTVHEDLGGYYGQGQDAFASSTLLTAGTDYYLELDGTLPGTSTACSYSGLLHRTNGVWTLMPRYYFPGRLYSEYGPVFGSVKVVYVGGYPTVPQDIQLACCMVVSALKRTVGVGGTLESERIGDYSYQLAFPRVDAFTYPEIGSVRAVLSKYKEVSF